MNRRIILVLPEPPLPFGGAAARWYYVLLRGLTARGHRVTAFATYEGDADLEAARALFPAPEYDLRLYRRGRSRGLGGKWGSFRRPFSFLYSEGFRRDLEAALAAGFDLLHLEQTWSGWMAEGFRDRSLLNVHFLFAIDLQDVPVKTPSDRLLRIRTLQAERRLLREFPTISTLTPRLSTTVREISPGSEVHTVPLGMDPSLYPFEPFTERARPVVGLVGSFNWHPSLGAGVRLLTRLWPEIKRRVPEAKLEIVGRQSRAALGNLATGDDIALAENVPDILPYFRNMDALLYAPSRGSGMKVKVMEAFALGVPVVTTSEGVEGLAVEDGREADVCEDDAGLIDRTVALLRDPALRDRRRVAARRLLEDHYSPGPTLDGVEAVHNRILAQGLATGKAAKQGMV